MSDDERIRRFCNAYGVALALLMAAFGGVVVLIDWISPRVTGFVPFGATFLLGWSGALVFGVVVKKRLESGGGTLKGSDNATNNR
jgi:hypothetical protein